MDVSPRGCTLFARLGLAPMLRRLDADIAGLALVCFPPGVVVFAGLTLLCCRPGTDCEAGLALISCRPDSDLGRPGAYVLPAWCCFCFAGLTLMLCRRGAYVLPAWRWFLFCQPGGDLLPG